MACHYVATSGCDGTLSPADTCVALRLAAGGSTSYDGATLAAADVSGDRQVVTSLGALMIPQPAVENVEL